MPRPSDSRPRLGLPIYPAVLRHLATAQGLLGGEGRGAGGVEYEVFMSEPHPGSQMLPRLLPWRST